jgi:hypothetical protein
MVTGSPLRLADRHHKRVRDAGALAVRAELRGPEVQLGRGVRVRPVGQLPVEPAALQAGLGEKPEPRGRVPGGDGLEGWNGEESVGHVAPLVAPQMVVPRLRRDHGADCPTEGRRMPIQGVTRPRRTA